MSTPRDRLVIVDAGALDDLCVLAELAVDRLPEDALTSALVGALGEVRAHALLEA